MVRGAERVLCVLCVKSVLMLGEDVYAAKTFREEE